MREIRSIIVHHSWTPKSIWLKKSVNSFNRRHKKKLHPQKNSMGYHIAYHYVIWPDGNHVKTRWLDEVWYHAGNRDINNESIGICFVGNFTEEKPTEHQIIKFQYLRKELEKKLGWLAVWLHNEYSKTGCPWKNIIKEELLQLQEEEKTNEWWSLVQKGIWNWKRPHDPATRLEVATMIERSRLMESNILRDKSKPIVDKWVDAALPDPEHNVTIASDIMTFREMRKLPRSEYNYFARIQENPELQLDQDELEEESNRCTLYWHAASLTHRGIDTTKEQRKKLYERYQDNGYYENWSWASTVKIWLERWKALQETGVYNGNVNTYIFKTWSLAMQLLLFYYWHYFVTSTLLSDDLTDDRRDNSFIDGPIHGWDIRGGHAHGWCPISSNMLLRVNSYSKRRNNHAVIEKPFMNQYNSELRPDGERWVREYSVLHIYQ